jgi:hypothetical protein
VEEAVYTNGESKATAIPKAAKPRVILIMNFFAYPQGFN